MTILETTQESIYIEIRHLRDEKAEMGFNFNLYAAQTTGRRKLTLLENISLITNI